LNLINNVLYY